MQSGPQQPRSPDGAKRSPGRSTVADFLDSPPGLHPGYNSIRIKSSMVAALPVNPLTRIADIDSNHLNAPRNSIEEIIRWTTEVAAR
jgi:hypothetical protein